MATPVTKLYLGETLGAILLGNIVAAIFYGITNMQTYIYYVRNRGDPLALKSLVFILWLLDSVHLAFITHTVYTYTITDFGDPLAITKPIWSVIAQVLVTCLSDMLIRGFFCHWVWKLSFRSRFIVAPIAASSLLAFVGGLGMFICISAGHASRP
ncbi:hypothetical protein AcV5_006483 [Taiwanofungus camphoratus]|nr:hypothetical protein AcW2_004924 [Antrodia cinnamomea]KAI0934740.1 hypothetical protein AcV5_006483 [Antrodia cinnamomea]